MDLNLTFRNTDSSPALVSLIERRAQHLRARAGRRRRLRAICSVDAGQSEVELILSGAGPRLVARSACEDMYEAANEAFERLERRVDRERSRRVARRASPARKAA